MADSAMKGQHYSQDNQFSFEFELLNSDDGRLITLVCALDREISPEEYAEALRAFADHIESLTAMAEAGAMN